MRVGKKNEPAVVLTAGRNPASAFYADWEETADVKSALSIARKAEAEGLLKKARAWTSIARQRVEAHLKELKQCGSA